MKNGFSFLSMLITVLIIGILMATLAPRYANTVKQQQQMEQNALRQVQQVQQQINAHAQHQQHTLEQLEGTPTRRR